MVAERTKVIRGAVVDVDGEQPTKSAFWTDIAKAKAQQSMSVLRLTNNTEHQTSRIKSTR